MTDTTSFRNSSGPRPSHYRTPSPPRRAVESISPPPEKIFHPPCGNRESAGVDGNNSNNGLDGIFDGNGYNQGPPGGYGASNSKPRGGGGHGRSASTIDTLATIALATSPTFATMSYNPTNHDPPAPMPNSTVDGTSPERPSKRARSEKAPSPTWQKVGARPVTSHVSALDSMKTDAELLLNFARPTNFHQPTTYRPHASVDESANRIRWDDTTFGHTNGNFGLEEEKASSIYAHNSSPSRVRSRSDGSTAMSRPVLLADRPNTSSSHIPSKLWDSVNGYPDGIAGSQYAVTDAPADIKPEHNNGHGNVYSQHALETADSDTKDKDGDSDASEEASCAACNLIRFMDGEEEQNEVTWVGCDGCKKWFHIACAGFKSNREMRTVDKFICKTCRPKFGPTTFVRKSSRARTAIDYAGLNQGLVKASNETPWHHYIEPIKEGKITFLPETFPRMRPELVTAEHFERCSGMSEPIIIPAYLNTHPSASDSAANDNELLQKATTQEEFDELFDRMVFGSDGTDVEEVVDCGQDLLDMVIPKGLTVRTVSELYGPDEHVEVIDVKSQQGEDKKWDMRRWTEYYEATGPKVVRNVISLEISQSQLGRIIRRPKIVRDLDLQDSVWPAELQAIGDFPKVQFYCLMSVADCYTDFHIDFGGSSVYYHILKGSKTFFFIPPKDKHLKKYEEWCNSAVQDTTFLGDQTKECYRVDLAAGDTMMIPAGWIHAVWTPANSLVIGGNFLTRLNYGMQIKVAKIEKETKVPRKFRYPFFQKIQWYTASKYLEDDPVPQSVLDSFSQDANFRFHRKTPIYYEFGERKNDAEPGSEYYNSRFYSQAELEGLPDLANYLLRTAMIAAGYLAEGVTVETRNAIKRSIPKGTGDPIEVIKKFGVWIAWKRGNERAAPWTRPGGIAPDAKADMLAKKPSVRPSRRSERNAAEVQRVYTERQAVRRFSESQSETPSEAPSSTNPVQQVLAIPITDKVAPANPVPKENESPKPRSTPKSTGIGPKRVACDACRKRRIRCRHKDEQNGTSPPAKPHPAKHEQFPTTIHPHSITGDISALAMGSAPAHVNDMEVEYGGFEGGNDVDPMVVDDERYNAAILNTPQAPVNKPNGFSPDASSSSKKGRSKACDECRKSKRRCIHDENGKVDPVKAQERSKPRVASSAKRRLSDESAPSTSHKKTKLEPESPVAKSGNMPHPEIPNTVLHDATNSAPLQRPEEIKEAGKGVLANGSYASPPELLTDQSVATQVNTEAATTAPVTTTLVSPPTSLADDVDTSLNHNEGEMRPSIEGGHEGEHLTTLHTPNSTSRHSSRQPRQVDRYVPEVVSTTRGPKSAPKSSSSHHHHLNHPSTKPAGVAVEAKPTSSVKKPSSRPTSSHHHPSSGSSMPIGNRGSSVTDRGGPHDPHSGKVVKGEGSASATTGEDMESLKLIQELHEQDFGLRRRGRS
ncbi:JmjC domain-containing histone demethylation protein 1 [Arachnomyces sp. PD_36]|nr:JmjC domain-containing histone demethylation protein 1 [Arachnomyces sp. PD_36]